MIYIIGDRPSKRTNPAVPFQGAACEKRFNEWLKYLGIVDYSIMNQCDLSSLQLVVFYVNVTLADHKVIALGNNASKRLYMFDIPHFKLPHPSGRNRQINDSKFIVQQLNTCKKFLQKTLKF